MEQESLAKDWYEKLSDRKKIALSIGMLAVSCGFCSDERKSETCPFKKCLGESEEIAKVLEELLDKNKHIDILSEDK